MKRSEMIKKFIKSNITDLGLGGLKQKDGSVIDIRIDTASRILNFFEKCGMTPPEYLPEPKYCEITGKQLECKPIREWEKE